MQPDSTAMVQSHDSNADRFFEQLMQEIGESDFRHWFEDKSTLTVTGEQFVVGVSSPFLVDWMQKRFRPAVTSVAASLMGPTATVRFQVDPEARQCSEPVSPKSAATVAPTDERDRKPDRSSTKSDRPSAPVRTGRRFADLADFVCGEGNELAVTAAKQVSNAPGVHFNPLFLYGGVGMGKTHLLEGIYRAIRRRSPSLQVMFLTSEAFTNYFTEALRERTLPSFRQRLRTVDVLVVDDVEFFESKRVVQEEFLHTFKQLESHSRQLVLTGDRHPRLLTKVSEELRTRFLSGLVCRLEAPNLETRREIVRRKAATLDAKISPEALEYVAERFRNNVRELEGALHCLATYFAMTERRVGITAARRVLSDLERDCVRIVRLADVERIVCEFFGVRPEDLKSKDRKRTISRPRMLAMFLARKHTQAAYGEIGEFFGGRNHSTVMSAEKQVRGWMTAETPIEIATHAWTMRDVLDTLEQQLQVG